MQKSVALVEDVLNDIKLCMIAQEGGDYKLIESD